VQFPVQQPSDSSDPELARNIPAEQQTQATSNIQAQRNEPTRSQVNPDQGIYSVKEYPV